MKKAIKSFTLLFTLLTMTIHAATLFFKISLPDDYVVSDDSAFNITPYSIISADKQKNNIIYADKNQNENSKKTVTLKMFKLIPIKEVLLKSEDRKYVCASGKPFGIKLYSKGVMIVGMSDIETADGTVNPAQDAGLEIGDIILEINSKKVASNEDVSKLVEESDGKELVLLIMRGKSEIIFKVNPVLSSSVGRYMAGIWVRDSSAGIGTLTFYDENGVFGGLGHPICDTDTGQIIPISSGELVCAEIGDVSKSISGSAGELKGYFSQGELHGKIYFNGESGIFGILDRTIKGDKIPIAHCQEVEIGPAVVLSTVEGSEPNQYSCVIERINYNGTSQAKNMTVRITDEKLLNRTGGIVQGMSGSPIIQNGRLIGAVTHVFVNNPTCGYAVFAENMWKAAQKAEEKSLNPAA